METVKTKQIYKWHPNQTRKLVEAFRDQPGLWDVRYRRSQHVDRSARNEMWIHIAEQMGVEREEVERKINSLLAQYRRERVRIARSGQHPAENQRRWPGYKWFDFLAKMDAQRAYLRSIDGRGSKANKNKKMFINNINMINNEEMVVIPDGVEYEDESRMEDDGFDDDYGDFYDDDMSALEPEVIVQEEEEDNDNSSVEELPPASTSSVVTPVSSVGASPASGPPASVSRPVIRLAASKNGSSILSGSLTVQTFRRILPKPSPGASPASNFVTSSSTSSSISSTSPTTISNKNASPTHVLFRKSPASSLVLGGKTATPLILKTSSAITTNSGGVTLPRVSSAIKGSPTVLLRPILPKPMGEQDKQQPKLAPRPAQPNAGIRIIRRSLPLSAAPTVAAQTVNVPLAPLVSQPRSEHDIFAEYISDKLKRFSDHVRNTVQFEINRIIYQAESRTGIFQTVESSSDASSPQ